MKRHLVMMVLGGLLGSVMFSGSAEACHKKARCHKATACVQPAPCPPPAPVVCEPVVCAQPVTCAPAPKVKKHCGLFGKMKLHHKKAAPVACQAPMTSVVYAPVSATPQASAQN
jgi:hypothetical protein